MNTVQSIALAYPNGIDNLSPETRLSEGALREAVNVDCYPSGAIYARPGLRLVGAGSFHSLYTPEHGAFSLCWKDGALTRLNGNTLTSLLALSDAPIVYADVNGETYWTNGQTVGRVTRAGMATFWGLPNPPPLQVSAVASGGLGSGIYQVAYAAVVNGIESGASKAIAVTVAEGGGVQVTVPLGASFNVYRTPPNGAASDLRLAATLTAGATATLGVGVLGKVLDSLFAIKPIAGQAIAAHKGRLWVGSGAALWFTSEKSPHWLVPDVGYFLFPSSITMLGVAADGLYVGHERGVDYLQGGDPASMTLRRVSDVAPTSAALSLSISAFNGDQQAAGQQCCWIDAMGQTAVGKAGGFILHPHRLRYSLGTLSGVTLAESQRQGLRHIVVASAERASIPLLSTDIDIEETFQHGVDFNSPF